ncbi:hypothetical protein RchiOBHm_Chr5g0012731 [Rosa chinensis]|uniref:Uncharacterized protein n=1 Tax=Rosa chinensis TaxID=74649 RepID=A0A2P6Q563_ROSCH|nr:hypothetical protein RchiOBHm_Chr5g0012731 [Rosa chinensis]
MADEKDKGKKKVSFEEDGKNALRLNTDGGGNNFFFFFFSFPAGDASSSITAADIHEFRIKVEREWRRLQIRAEHTSTASEGTEPLRLAELATALSVLQEIESADFQDALSTELVVDAPAENQDALSTELVELDAPAEYHDALEDAPVLDYEAVLQLLVRDGSPEFGTPFQLGLVKALEPLYNLTANQPVPAPAPDWRYSYHLVSFSYWVSVAMKVVIEEIGRWAGSYPRLAGAVKWLVENVDKLSFWATIYNVFDYGYSANEILGNIRRSPRGLFRRLDDNLKPILGAELQRIKADAFAEMQWFMNDIKRAKDGCISLGKRFGGSMSVANAIVVSTGLRRVIRLALRLAKKALEAVVAIVQEDWELAMRTLDVAYAIAAHEDLLLAMKASKSSDAALKGSDYDDWSSDVAASLAEDLLLVMKDLLFFMKVFEAEEGSKSSDAAVANAELKGLEYDGKSSDVAAAQGEDLLLAMKAFEAEEGSKSSDAGVANAELKGSEYDDKSSDVAAAQAQTDDGSVAEQKQHDWTEGSDQEKQTD